MDIINVLRQAVRNGASDIHFVPRRPPMVRINGQIMPFKMDPVTPAQLEQAIFGILRPDQVKAFEERWELDASLAVPELCRFRVNVLKQIEGTGAVMRVISDKIPSPEDIGLGESILQFKDLPRGLVLVTGPTGSGKSTTLASLIDQINANNRVHILTIEDPIEYVYTPKKAIVTQREVGGTTHTFNEALRHAMRQDPNVVLIGEMRDLETISLAITIAETGHLAFGTLHTTDAAQTVDRIIDVFPSHQQQQVRMQLSTTLKGVVCQALLPRADGKGRVAVREVMVCNHAIGNLIREGKTHQLYTAIETGGKYGMISFDRHLTQMVAAGEIKLEDAMAKANDPKSLKAQFEKPAAPAGAR